MWSEDPALEVYSFPDKPSIDSMGLLPGAGIYKITLPDGTVLRDRLEANAYHHIEIVVEAQTLAELNGFRYPVHDVLHKYPILHISGYKADSLSIEIKVDGDSWLAVPLVRNNDNSVDHGALMVDFSVFARDNNLHIEEDDIIQTRIRSGESVVNEFRLSGSAFHSPEDRISTYFPVIPPVNTTGVIVPRGGTGVGLSVGYPTSLPPPKESDE